MFKKIKELFTVSSRLEKVEKLLVHISRQLSDLQDSLDFPSLLEKDELEDKIALDLPKPRLKSQAKSLIGRQSRPLQH